MTARPEVTLPGAAASQPDVHLILSPVAPRPGDQFAVQIAWNLPERCSSIELRLCWKISTPAGERIVIHARDADRDPFPRGSRNVTFTLPRSPYSFQGRLARLEWLVEVVVLPLRWSTRAGFVLAPGDGPVSHLDGDRASYEIRSGAEVRSGLVPDQW